MNFVRWLAVIVIAFFASATAVADDEIKLTFLGTGAPRPSLERYGPSILVEAGRHKLLVDAGPGMRERLFQAGGFEILTDVNRILIKNFRDQRIGRQQPNRSLAGGMLKSLTGWATQVLVREQGTGTPVVIVVDQTALVQVIPVSTHQ